MNFEDLDITFWNPKTGKKFKFGWDEIYALAHRHHN